MPREQHDKGVRESSRVDLRGWIVTDHASTATRFEQAIGAHVPVERWKERAGGDGASIAWLLFHLSYHQDLALNSAVLGQPPLLADHRDRLGLAGIAAHEGLGEAELPDVTTALELDSLSHYAAAVHLATSRHLATADLGRLDDEVHLDGLADTERRPAGRRAMALRHVDGQDGGVDGAVGDDRARARPHRRDDLRPRPPGPQPVLTEPVATTAPPDRCRGVAERATMRQ